MPPSATPRFKPHPERLGHGEHHFPLLAPHVKLQHHIMKTFPFCSPLILGASIAVVSAESAPATPNFNEHVAPIIFNHCASCHRPGEAAPFSLMNYDDVKKRGRLIARVTEKRYMPPWHAESTDYRFADERKLTDAQIEIIQAWVKNGSPEGGPAKRPALPEFTDGWQLGTPDLVVKMSEGYTVPAEGPDIYRNFVVPLNIKEDKWVQAVEFRPGARSVVHHSLFFLDVTGEARQLDADDPAPGFKRMGLALQRGGTLGGWAVGGTPNELPDGLAYKLPKGSDLILSTHFHPSGKEETEVSTLGIYFADKPPAHGFTAIQLPPVFGALAGIDIPAGEADYTKTDSFTLPVDVRAFAVSAHAHYLGKEIKMTATLPGGETRELLWIRDWDFAWQEQYKYSDWVELPAGTRIDAKVVWDNSADNVFNPHDPPQRVRWGKESTDEMGSVTLQVMAADSGALRKLNTAINKHRREAGEQAIRNRFADRSKNGRGGSLMQRLLTRFDKDGDGKLSAEERRSAVASIPQEERRRLFRKR